MDKFYIITNQSKDRGACDNIGFNDIEQHSRQCIVASDGRVCTKDTNASWYLAAMELLIRAYPREIAYTCKSTLSWD